MNSGWGEWEEFSYLRVELHMYGGDKIRRPGISLSKVLNYLAQFRNPERFADNP